MTTLFQDLKYAVRMLTKNRGFALVVILTMALGIGANTAIFSLIEAVLLRPLAYRNPESLVEVWNTFYPAWPQIGLSGSDFENWNQQTKSLKEMAAYRFVTAGVNLTGSGEPERVQISYATSNLLPMLGVAPIVGRSFDGSEDKAGGAAVAMISEHLWRTRFGSNPAVIGQAITLDGKGQVVIGVLPASFRLLPSADLWVSAGQMAPTELTGRLRHALAVVARLRPGTTISEAQAEISGMAAQAAAEFPKTNKNFGVVVRQLKDPDGVRLGPTLVGLFAIVGFVLMIACVNVANLMLARSAGRRNEMAVRASIGASQARLARQLLTESMLLSFLGGALGLVLGFVSLKVLLALGPPELANLKSTVGLNGQVLGFTSVLCFLAGAICGLAPALRFRKPDLQAAMTGGIRSTRGIEILWLQNLLVVSEIALAFMPLVAAGLLVRSFNHLLSVGPGFKTQHILTMQVSQTAIPGNVFRDYSPEQRQDYFRRRAVQFEEVADAIRALPGIEAVGGISSLPLTASLSNAGRFVLEGEDASQAEQRSVEVLYVNTEYFSTLSIPLLQGRPFNQNDWAIDRVTINDAMARRFWPHGDAVGRRINLCPLDIKGCWATIIGVVGDVRQIGLDGAPTFDVYYTGTWYGDLVIRTAGNPYDMATGTVRAIHDVAPNLPVTRVASMDDMLSQTVAPRRMAVALLAAFASLALVLAMVGIYGVMSYAVVQRRQELGIRMALGAQRSNILNLVLARGGKMVSAGMALGIASSLLMGRFLLNVLYGVHPADPATFGVVVLLLAVVAFTACYIPARRALEVSPTVVLRRD
jgi:putative ABC transport system permease protein